MGGSTPSDYPRSLAEFYRRFHSDDACLHYLMETRWPSGFCCPKCGGRDGRPLERRRVVVCHACRHQASATAGTVLHRTRVPLPTWFAAAYLVASLKPGISALQLQAQLGISRYETAWLLLHKLRRAMVDPDRSHLSGTVEIDETWVGGKQPGLQGGRRRESRKALMVVVAVERRERSLGRLRLEVIPNDSGATLRGFIARNVAPGSTVVSDAWKGYAGLAEHGYTHVPLSQAGMKREGLEGDAVPGVHRVVSNLKTWIMGTHHGVGAAHLDHYLNEFVFRFNRRHHPMAGFARLLALGVSQPPTSAAQIRAPLPPRATRGRPGRSTGLTKARRSGDEPRS